MTKLQILSVESHIAPIPYTCLNALLMARSRQSQKSIGSNRRYKTIRGSMTSWTHLKTLNEEQIDTPLRCFRTFLLHYGLWKI